MRILELEWTHSLSVMSSSVETLENYIGGEFVECSSHLDSYNPATGKIHLKVPDSGKEEVQAAVEAARKAFKTSDLLLT